MSLAHLLHLWLIINTLACCSATFTHRVPQEDNYYIFPIRLKQSVPLVRHGRRLTEASGKVDVDGSVRVGYFYAVLPLGTPATNFDVIVDTGSTVTYVPCNDCKHCGKHNGVPFNPAKSATSKWLSCGDQQCKQLDTYYCDRVQYPGQCVYRIAYAEQSTSEGRLVQDVFTFPDSSTKVPVTFGCVEGETGEIFKQRPDGIVGMSNSPGAFHSQLAAAGAIPHMFSLCFGFPTGGALLLGNAPIPGNPKFSWTPFTTSGWGDFFSVDLQQISIGDKPLDVPEYAFDTGYRTVLDSGTTFIYLTTPVYRKFAAVIQAAAVAAGLRETTDSYGDICWTGAGATFDELQRFFPAASMTFAGGAELKLPPYRYMFQLSAEKGTYCLAVFDNGGAGSLIGGVATRSVLVQYDVVNQRIGFADVDCQALGELPGRQVSNSSNDSRCTPSASTSLQHMALHQLHQQVFIALK